MQPSSEKPPKGLATIYEVSKDDIGQSNREAAVQNCSVVEGSSFPMLNCLRVMESSVKPLQREPNKNKFKIKINNYATAPVHAHPSVHPLIVDLASIKRGLGIEDSILELRSPSPPKIERPALRLFSQ